MPHILSTDSKLLQSNGQAGTATVITNHYVSGDGTVSYPVGLTFEPSDLMTNTSSWKPTVDSSGNLSWTLTDNTDTPATVNIKGQTGPQGEQGPQGPAGADGAQGPQGVPGNEGPQGIQGERGPAGPQGEQGEQGPAGQDGAPGKSAYEIAVEDGYTGTSAEWLESLKGDPGEDGFSPTVSAEAIASGTRITITDAVSSTVFDVMNGERGPEGPSGAQGPQGPEGPSGAQGPAGQDGRDGADGASGFSPIVSTTPIASGTQVTITDLTGSHSFNVMNGEQGPSGAQGPQGPSGESYTGSLMPLIGDNGIAVTSNAGNAVVEISSVAHDATISGNGTVASPLGVVGGGGKTYTGVAPIVVNNNEDKISANCIELSAGNGIDSTKLALGVIEVSGGAVTITQSPAGPVSITDGIVTAYCINDGIGQGFLYHQGAGLIRPVNKEITDITITMNASTLTSVELSSYNSYNKVTVVTPNVYDGGHPGVSSYPLYVDNVKQIDMLSGAYYTFLKGQHDDEGTRWCCGVSGYWDYMPVITGYIPDPGSIVPPF